MVQPPRAWTQAAIPPREYVFVLDVSGSMHGFPLDTAKVLMRDLLGGCARPTRFNVVLFSGDSSAAAPSVRCPPTGENVERAIALIDRERGGGGTELGGGAASASMSCRAAEHVSRSFVVVTDGYIAEERGVVRADRQAPRRHQRVRVRHRQRASTAT